MSPSRNATLLAAVAAVLLLAAPPADAADRPTAQLFAGYSFLKADPKSLNGFDAALDWNARGALGLTLGVGGNYATDKGVKHSELSFLAGPRLARHRESVTPFVYAVAGVVRSSDSVSVLQVSLSESSTDFGFAAGGGVDVRLARRVALRLQGDYFAVRRSDASGAKTTDGNPRLALGCVYRFGL